MLSSHVKGRSKIQRKLIQVEVCVCAFGHFLSKTISETKTTAYNFAFWIQTSDKGGVLLCRFMSVDFRSLSCPLLLPLRRKIFISHYLETTNTDCFWTLTLVAFATNNVWV